MADLDLARRALDAEGWWWDDGMLAMVRYRDHPCAPIEADRMRHRVDCRCRTDDLNAAARSRHRWMGIEDHDPIPDLDDPATLGCLLALVRERWGVGHMLVPFATHVNDGEGGTMPAIWWCLARVHIDVWCTLTQEPQMWPGEPNRFVAGPTMVEAAIAALEAPAPRQEDNR